MAQERLPIAPHPFGIVLKDATKVPSKIRSAPEHDCQNGDDCCFLDCERHFIGNADHGKVTYPRRFWDMNAENATLINENRRLGRRLSHMEIDHEHDMRANNAVCRSEVARHRKVALEEMCRRQSLGRRLVFADGAKDQAECAQLDSEKRLAQAQEEMEQSKTQLRAANNTIRQLRIEKHELSKDKVELAEKAEYAYPDLQHEVRVQKSRARDYSKQVSELEKKLKQKDKDHEREVMSNLEAHEHWMDNADLSSEALKELLHEAVAEKQTMAKEVEDLKLENAVLKRQLEGDQRLMTTGP